MLFLSYPKCSTCQKAKKFLLNNNIDFEERHIVENNPTKEELEQFLQIGNLPIKKLFNTSGKIYKELNLKEKLPTLSKDEALELLSTNGMLVKRPLLICSDKIYVGFKENEWSELIK